MGSEIAFDQKHYQVIEGAQKRHDAAVEAGDAKVVFRANFRVPRGALRRVRQSLPRRSDRRLSAQDHVVWSYAVVKPEYFRNAQREHRAMLRALREGDRRRLIELCAAHLDISARPICRPIACVSNNQDT